MAFLGFSAALKHTNGKMVFLHDLHPYADEEMRDPAPEPLAMMERPNRNCRAG